MTFLGALRMPAGATSHARDVARDLARLRATLDFEVSTRGNNLHIADDSSRWIDALHVRDRDRSGRA